MAEDNKDTIYIDVDDEITTVIDKVIESNKKLVALVLPKRASVFQSIVNMKLLKRKSEEANKNLVLVTSESSLLPLAGAVGIHVAKTLASKPEIPAAPVIEQPMLEAAEEDIPLVSTEPDEAKELKNEALKEINKAKPKTTGTEAGKDLDTIELDNTDEQPTDTAMPAAAIAQAEAKKKAKKKKSLKVPNFERFRLIALLGTGLIILLVVLWLLLFKVFPHATVDIKTNAQNVDATLTFNMSSNASGVNTTTDTVRAKQVTESKTYTATVNSTGQQNNGQKASGQVTFTYEDCDLSTPPTISAGTGIVQNGLTYITQSGASFTNFVPKNHCFYSTSNSVNIIAQQGGSNYNTSSNNTTFTVPSSGVNPPDSLFATGGANGGTDDIVTVVSQADITNAENKITQNTSGAKSDLTNQLSQDNYYPINATFNASNPNISPNAAAGTAASSVTVTETVQYSMYGVIKSDLTQLLNNSIQSQVNSNQSILNNGLSTASFTVGSTPTSVTLATTAIVGPNINITTLKKEISGQKVQAIESLIKSNPNVSSVSVQLSPFYVSQAPSPSKITINIAKPTNSPSNASTN
ncbi:MAG: hypothetical protein ACYCPS_05210 [Candidatus Saccharimonadales bacterium]